MVLDSYLGLEYRRIFLKKINNMAEVVSLCKRRGFVFQNSEIYGGLKSCYDYGPLGVELKRNIADQWWDSVVTQRSDVVGMEGSIFMHPQVWRTSGHVGGFNDPLVDCHNCKERFRPDKVELREVGSEVIYVKGGKKKGQKLKGVVGPDGYVCPVCQSPDLSEERQFNLMFNTQYGPIDPTAKLMNDLAGKAWSKEELAEKFKQALDPGTVYLRPETAQAIFVQYLNVQQTTSMKPPFGIAQMGKSFRNEIVTEHFIFRSCEFEQMEMEFFVPPGEQAKWLDYWKDQRIKWYRDLANYDDAFRLRSHDESELAHYADACYDIEYDFPWGWDELEGVASRTNYDLAKHAEASKVKLSYFDQQAQDPETGKTGWRYIPYVIEPAAGLTRAVLVYLCDALHEDETTDANGNARTRQVLKLHPKLAPYKASFMPLLRKPEQKEFAQKLADQFRKKGISVTYDEVGSIGKRYARHDEIGTPFACTVDEDSMSDQCVTVRNRDTCQQERVHADQLLEWFQGKIG